MQLSTPVPRMNLTQLLRDGFLPSLSGGATSLVQDPVEAMTPDSLRLALSNALDILSDDEGGHFGDQQDRSIKTRVVKNNEQRQ